MKKTIRYAFTQTAPVLLGYVFLGLAFGILLEQAGYSVLWAFCISLFLYAGSMQFVLVGLLASGASVVTTAVTTLFVNCRHIFYGLSFIDRFRAMGKAYPYMVSSLTDETYSVLCASRCPEDVDEKKASFLIALFNQCYWVAGSVLGGLAGRLITLDFTGIDFSMTALFVIIFIDQWKSFRSHLPALAGLFSALLFLSLMGPDRFLLPALLTAAVFLLFARKAVEGNLEVGK